MSVDYVRVQWTPYKKYFDLIMASCLAIFLVLFVALSLALPPENSQPSAMIVLIRAFGTSAVILLHVILASGPLARLDKRFLPLMYNRRHLGVTLFILALFHSALVTLFYHGFGVLNPFVSIFSSNVQYESISAFPFEIFGVIAFAIFFVLAATSHDFWQKYLGKSFWKSMHMLVYLSYGAVIAHVMLGIYLVEQNPAYSALIGLGFLGVAGLHVASSFKDRDEKVKTSSSAGWLEVARVNDFVLDRAKIVAGKGERIAVFKSEKGFSGITNVCAHQAGPIGEGKIVDGCITCPWHGWQYRPEDGESPPPFEEKISIHKVKIENQTVFVFEEPEPLGTKLSPVKG